MRNSILVIEFALLRELIGDNRESVLCFGRFKLRKTSKYINITFIKIRKYSYISYYVNVNYPLKPRLIQMHTCKVTLIQDYKLKPMYVSKALQVHR